MNNELASILEKEGSVSDWARKLKYNIQLSSEEKDISTAMDAFWKEVGRTGYDRDHELSALITKALTPESVEAPNDLIARLFDENTIGEFDDFRGEVAPKNTIKVYESIVGGNVDRSFIDHTVLTPSYKELQAETDISFQDLRKGGYKNVANLIMFIREAFDQKKVSLVMTAVSDAITSGAVNYINETTTAPTDTSMKALSLYLNDVSDGSAPFAFGLNKYMQVVAGLTGVTTYLTDVEKSLWNSTGFMKEYAGIQLMGYSGQKKLVDGSFIVPDYSLIGASGKIGDAITRGETRVMQAEDINAEKIHIKVNGYTFGWAIKDITKAAKVVIASA